MTVGERIKKKRLELGMTQDELAKKAGYKSRSSINKIECSRDLPIKKVKKVAAVLECTPSYLMGWEDDSTVIEMADVDTNLILMETRIKEYAIKLSNMSKEKQEHIMSLIDMLEEKEE